LNCCSLSNQVETVVLEAEEEFEDNEEPSEPFAWSAWISQQHQIDAILNRLESGTEV
jgi:hypothetical protein